MIAQLGKYRIDSLLGEGAMGVVYKAFDPGIARVVALKTIRKALLARDDQAEMINRFKHEAQAAGRLHHPNIVTVFDFGEDAQSAYIAMEFVEGAGLDTLLAPARPTPLARVLAWMEQLLTALDYAHARGVVHRDIKPANLLITPGAQLKILDFGIARLDSSNLTQSGAMVGTPGYMAPEQFRGDAVDGRTDVFASAIVLYQLLTGTRPFSGTASSVMQQILNLDPPPPSTLPGAPGGCGTRFDTVLARALAKRADARYPSARAFLDALLASAREGPDPDATALADHDLTVLAPAMAASARRVPASTVQEASTAAADGSVVVTMTPWKREAFPDVEASLAREIGPVARYLLKKMGAEVQGLDHLCELLLPHIPSSEGRAQFRQALVVIRKKLDASGTGSGATRTDARTGTAGTVASTASMAGAPMPDVDEAYADATAHQLVALIGPIGRVVVRRAMQQSRDRHAFVQLIATHIDNQDARARFVADALARP